MKICLVCGTWPGMRCGVGDYTSHLAQALCAAGESVTVVTSAVPGAEAPPGIDVRPDVRRWTAAGIPELARALDRARPDWVHLQYPCAAYGRGAAPVLLLPWLRLARPQWRRAVTLHEYGMLSRAGRMRLWPMLAAAEAVVCTNHEDRRRLRSSRWGRKRGVRVIPLGSSVGPFPGDTIGSGRTSEPGSPPWLLHFGTVMPNKGWETLLAAVCRLRASGRDVGVRVIGELQPGCYAYHRRIGDMIRAHGLERQVVFSGYLAPALVGAAMRFSPGIAVQPYTAGAALNRSSLVAMLAYGLAVVTTRPARPLEGLAHGRNYWGVPPQDPEALAAGIRRVLDDPALTARLQAGARAAAPRFAWSRIARRMREMYSTARKRNLRGEEPCL